MIVSEAAVAALVAALAPTGAVVKRDATAPDEVGPAGLLIVHTGIPGDPIDTTLSPVRRTYDHAALIEVRAQDAGSRAPARVDLRSLLVAVESAVKADPTLGGTIESVRLRPPTALLPNMPLPTASECRLVQVFLRYTVEG